MNVIYTDFLTLYIVILIGIGMLILIDTSIKYLISLGENKN